MIMFMICLHSKHQERNQQKLNFHDYWIFDLDLRQRNDNFETKENEMKAN